MVVHPFDPNNEIARKALLELALAQNARFQAWMPSLLASPTPEDMARRFGDAERLVIVEDSAGQVRGAVQPAVWRVDRASILRAFVMGRNGVAQQMILPPSQDADVGAVMKTFLQELGSFWRTQNTEADLLQWPALDTWFVPMLKDYGFQLDSICATRSLDPFFQTPPALSSGLAIRSARPTDEDALVRLFHEELRFHERSSPFVHSSKDVLLAFRGKLGRLWSGRSFEEGAPLITVVACGNDLIAMAESTLIRIDAGDEPGWAPPGRYWCIDNVSVSELFHNLGIGRVLVHAIESMRLILGLDLVGYMLWYNPDNTTAARFWSRRGFLPVWTTYQRRKVGKNLEYRRSHPSF